MQTPETEEGEMLEIIIGVDMPQTYRSLQWSKLTQPKPKRQKQIYYVITFHEVITSKKAREV